MQRSLGASAAALLLLAACDDRPTAEDLLGPWGGEHVALTVTTSGATLEYDCASGTVDEPIVPDDHGRFEARGTFVPGKGGPVFEGEEPIAHPAGYQGNTDGRTMTLRVSLLETNESLGTFVLAKGAPPRVFHCL